VLLRKLFYIFFLLPFAITANSQNFSNLRSNACTLLSDTLLIDSVSIVPGSIFIFNDKNGLIPDSLYKIDYAKALLFPSASIKGQKVRVSYRRFPLSFTKEYYHKDYSNFMINQYNPSFRYRSSDIETQLLFSKDGLNKSGSISRGISFGNSQDLTVNSTLNLQISGKLSDNLNIVAVISDNNIPIQADGNSQQIQDFDKVYIQLYNEKMSLTVGDFEIGKPVGYFINMNKKAQGASFTTEYKVGKEKQYKLKSTISGAVSKGKYNRMSFNGTEADQGPYTLTGAESESYIVVLSGTEKVYIDGKLMKRGADNDYVIDYNSAALTFTTNQPITKDKRIIIEFEYSDKNYARFLGYTSNELTTKKGSYWFNLYWEQDNKNQPLQQSLTTAEKKILAAAGDSTSLAVVPSADSVAFDGDLVLYRKADTLVNGTRESIYIYSTNEDSAYYYLTFSKRGTHKGDYVQVVTSANGQVYKWVAPVNGVQSGNYAPVTQLVAPKKKLVLTIGGRTRLNRTTSSFFEVGFSNNDKNTFSSIDKGDDIGYALNLKLLKQFPSADTSKMKLSSSFSYQYLNKNFDPVERFRSSEFERDWNLTSTTLPANEHYLSATLGYDKKNDGSFTLNAEALDRENFMVGIKNSFSSRLHFKSFELSLGGSLLNSKDTLDKTLFLKHNISISRGFGRLFKLGIKEEGEYNKWDSLATDSLMSRSYKYNQFEIFIQNSDSAKKNNFSGSYTRRLDYLPKNNVLKYTSLADVYAVGLEWLKNEKQTLKTNLTYRKLVVFDTSLVETTSQNSLLGRVEHNMRLFNGFITTGTLFEVGSGVEQKLTYYYSKVTKGQGIYIWTDYNADGVAQLNEFDVAAYQDEANYIRVSTTSSTYVNAYTNQWNELINIQPSRKWQSKKGVKKFLTRFTNQFAYNIYRKVSESNAIKNINPFLGGIDDSNLLSLSNTLRNTLSFSTTNSKLGIDHSFQKNISRTTLVNGFDTRRNLINSLKIKWNLSREIIFTNETGFGNKIYTSQYFSSKSYELHYLKDKLSVNFQPSQKFSATLDGILGQNRNKSGGEKAIEKNLGTEMKYSVLNKGNFSLRVDYYRYSYNAETSTSLSYEMLQGLVPGNNFTWTMLFRQSLVNGLEINLTYTGRATASSKTVHTGSVQVRANF
jgi:hypothetical protein